MHVYSRTTLAFAAFLPLFFVLPISSRGVELVPFPSTQIQTTQTESVESRFRNSIQNLNCAELGKLKETLSGKTSPSSTAADRSYYAKLIGIVAEKAALMTCPAH
jgi:hypothetical protein